MLAACSISTIRHRYLLCGVGLVSSLVGPACGSKDKSERDAAAAPVSNETASAERVVDAGAARMDSGAGPSADAGTRRVDASANAGGGAGRASSGRGGAGAAGADAADGVAGAPAGTAADGGQESGGAGHSGSGGMNLAGAGGQSGEPGPAHGQVVQVLDDASGITVASDAAGVLQIAAVARQSVGYALVYGRCAASCSDPSAWHFALLGPADSFLVPTIGLTRDGQPRIGFSRSTANDSPGQYYAECNEDCDSSDHWSYLRLTASSPMGIIMPRPKLPFAVSPSGAAALLYRDNMGSHAVYCHADCANPASWGDLIIGDYYLSPLSVAFGADESLHALSWRQTQSSNLLTLSRCSGDCTIAANWIVSETILETPSLAVFQAEIALTAQAAPRIALYVDDPNAPGNERLLFYLACDADCDRTDSWLLTPLPLGPQQADIGFGLAFGAQDEPAVAVATLAGVERVTCSGGCDATSGWQTAFTLDSAALASQYPLPVPSDCTDSSWLVYTGPALAFQAGKPVLAFAGDKRASGPLSTSSVCASFGNAAFVVLP